MAEIQLKLDEVLRNNKLAPKDLIDMLDKIYPDDKISTSTIYSYLRRSEKERREPSLKNLSKILTALRALIKDRPITVEDILRVDEETDNLIREAERNVRNHRYQKAIKKYQEIISNLSTQKEMLFEQANIHCEIGKLFHMIGRIKPALKEYEEAINLYRNTSSFDPLDMAYALTGKAAALRILGQTEDVEEVYGSVYDFLNRSANSWTRRNVMIEARSLRGEGDLRRRRSNIIGAIRKYTQAIHILKESIETIEREESYRNKKIHFFLVREWSHAHNGLGAVYRFLNHYEKAREYHDIARLYREKIDDVIGLGFTYFDLADTFRLQADIAKDSVRDEYIQNAKLFCGKALETAKVNDAIQLEALALYEFGLIERLQNRGTRNYKRAYHYFSQALDIFSSNVGDKAMMAYCLLYVAYIERRQNNLEEARNCLEQASTIFKDVNDRVGQIRVNNDLGRLYFKYPKFRDLIKSEDLYMKAKELSERDFEDPTVIKTLPEQHKLFSASQKMYGRWQGYTYLGLANLFKFKMEVLYKKALELEQPFNNELLNDFKQKLNLATTYFNRTQETFDPAYRLGIGYSYLGQGDIRAINPRTRRAALATYRAALFAFQSVDSRKDITTTLRKIEELAVKPIESEKVKQFWLQVNSL